MKTYPKRLIEVDLPIKRISAHARREKSIRHGHISTLHIWWARRPLAACRAVICAALWPDPADEFCPSTFREAAFQIMTDFAKHAMTDRTVRDELLSEHTLGRVMAINEGQSCFGPGNPKASLVLRQALLDFIADFANWDASTNPLFLKTVRALTQVAHEALGGARGTRPLVVDPFAGGGSIPVEALRVGADAFASDLNPVAVLLSKVAVEYIPKYGQQLADEVRKWGEWIKQEAEKELAEFYPKDQDGATPLAFFWARTIISDAPGDEVPVEVPLMRSLWLSKVKGHKWALRWVRDSFGKVQVETVQVSYADGARRSVRRPLLEVFRPARDSHVEPGTVAKGSATCPVTGYTTRIERVRAQLMLRRGGAADARLFCVAVSHKGEQGRFYRSPDEGDSATASAAMQELLRRQRESRGDVSLVPEEKISLNEIRRISVPLYGMACWADLFSPRQLLVLTTLCRLVSSIGHNSVKREDEGLALATRTCLAMAVDRQADYLSSLVVWASDGEFIAHTFGRQAIPMVWEWPECNPWASTSGNWIGAIEWIAKAIETAAKADWPGGGKALRANAVATPLPDDSADAVVTDPPYYDAIPYAYLSDFFYVWLTRSLRGHHRDLLSTTVVDKDGEIVVDRPHQLSTSTKDVQFYERELTKAFADCRRVARPSGIATVVFASKTTASWEAIIGALVESAWTITASWPIDTERAARVSAVNQARLASSIHLVCRPREDPDGSLRTDDVGDWREVLDELPKRIHQWMPRLAEEGVVGADAIFACLGPALEIFSRHSRVEKASGETVTLKEYLEQVWAAVAKEALTMIFSGADATGFQEDARITAMWLWTLRTSLHNGVATEQEEPDDRDDAEEDGGKSRQPGGYSLEYDAARKIAQGLGVHLESLAHLVEIKGDTATLLPVAARTRYLFGKESDQATPARRKQERQLALGLFDDLEEVEEASGGLSGALAGRAGATVLDQLHQAMILFGAGRSEALRRFLVGAGVGRNALFWRLAQSLTALYPTDSQEKRWLDGVLARKKGLGL